MKPSALLRTFSSMLSPSSVAPWPPARTPFDRWLTSELDGLRVGPDLYATAAWLSKSLDVAVSAQQTTAGSIKSTKTDAKAFDGYLDDTVELLDACSVVRRRAEGVRTYTDSVATALHYLEGARGEEPGRAVVRRAQAALESCAAMEKRCAELDTCGSSLRKLGEKLASQDRKQQQQESELHETLIGSRALALLVIGMANIALSFRSRRGVPVVQHAKGGGCWGSSLLDMQKEAKEEYEKRRKDGVAVLEELDATVSTVRRLRGLICRGEGGGGELRGVVRELRGRCEELEQGIRHLEGRVDGLYRGLIDVRMCLLGAISES